MVLAKHGIPAIARKKFATKYENIIIIMLIINAGLPAIFFCLGDYAFRELWISDLWAYKSGDFEA